MAVDLLKTLHQEFGFTDFRPGQLEVLTKLQHGDDVFAILPTGGGKTLIYQLFGKINSGTVVVVSPLISLMQDQVQRMQFLGEKRVVALTSTLSFFEKQTVLHHLSQYKYIYISPEMLSNPNVLEFFKKISIGLFVIDEAHCVSEWGPDFRPEYQDLGSIRQHLKTPLTLMITATATAEVQQDVIDKLGFNMGEVDVEAQPVNRSNIFLAAKIVSNEQAKITTLKDFLATVKGKGIIYFSSRSKAESVAAQLTAATRLKVLAYHGGMSNEDRYSVQQQFMNDQIDVICATSAFGMGIDKPDIRFVVHFHIPANLQSYMQEIGRCGRDGKKGIALALFSDDDRFIHLGLLDKTIPTNNEIEYAYVHPDVEFNDDSYRVLQYYIQHQVPLNKVKEIYERRKNRRLVELSQMIDYITSVTCRREKLLAPFQTGFTAESDFCCDLDSEFWVNKQRFVNDHLINVTKPTLDSSVENWHQVIEQLFLSKN